VSDNFGSQMVDLIDAGKMEEYAKVKKLALEKGGYASGKPVADMIEEAEGLHWKGVAMQELNSILKNPDIISGNVAYGTPEVINVDKMVVALQRMMNDKSCNLEGCSKFVHAGHGTTSHLVQALGQEAAEKMLREMYAAQRLGVAAEKKQRITLWVLAAGAVVALLGLIFWMMR
jgi:hypothetical protein